MFPLDPQTKATTSKPRNHSLSGLFSLPPPFPSSGLTSFASAEPTPTLKHKVTYFVFEGGKEASATPKRKKALQEEKK
jgi:hypothetical protein